MNSITVTQWLDYKHADKKSSIGGLGGWVNGDKWQHYIEAVPDHEIPYYVALRAAIVEQGMKISGEDHQYRPAGVPLFSDDTIGTFSFRAWGDLMAAIWNTEEDASYSYMDFYMGKTEQPK